jgi:hypothetical protein
VSEFVWNIYMDGDLVLQRSQSFMCRLMRFVDTHEDTSNMTISIDNQLQPDHAR